MEDIKLEKLKKELGESYDQVEASEKAFQEKVLSHNAISLPEGFKLNIELNARMRRNGTEKAEIVFKISDENSNKDCGYPKYFWTMDGKTTINFENDELTEYDSSSFQGGKNSREYNLNDSPSLDKIDLHEKTLQINKSYLNLMKIARASPEFFLEPLNVYRQANTKMNDLQDEYDTEIRNRKSVEKSNNLNIISDGFQTLGTKSVEKLLNKLKHTSESEISLSVVAIDETNNSYDKDVVRVRELKITCKHGARTSYFLEEGHFVGSIIKASDVAGHLARGVVLDGKRSETIDDFKETYSVNKDIDNSNREMTVDIKELAQVAKTLKKNTKQEVVSGNKNKLK